MDPTHHHSSSSLGAASPHKDHSSHSSTSSLSQQPVQDEQRKRVSFTNDFIVISEFSEQEGPIPLFIIPDGAEGTFNLNTFVVKIMAVDNQNKNSDPGSYIKDSQVVIPEPTEDAFAYVHNFTLLDIYARGYVRPMCMSYITHDPNKTMEFFQEFSNMFTAVSDILKKGNHKLFLRDLELRMADLHHTSKMLKAKDKRVEQPHTTDDPIEKQISPTAGIVSELIYDLQHMHLKIRNLLRQSNNIHNNGNDKAADKSIISAASANIDRKGIVVEGDGEAKAVDDHSPALSPVREGDGENDVSIDEGEERHPGDEHGDMLDDESDEEETKEFDEELLNEILASADISNYEPQIIYTLHKSLTEAKPLRDLYALCDGVAPKAMTLLRAIQAHFVRPLTVLTMEAFDAPMLHPVSSLLTIGQIPLLNFNLDADKTGARVLSPLDIDEHSSLLGSGGQERGGIVSPFIAVPHKSTNASEMSSNSSSYESPFSMSPSTPVLDAFVQRYSPAVLKTAQLSVSAEPDDPTAVHIRISEGSVEGSRGGSSVDGGSSGKIPVAHRKSSISTANLSSFSGILWPTLPVYNHSALAHPLSQSMSMRSLMELRNKYSWIRHLLYSILKGRPVLVYSSAANEQVVRGIISSLSVFVPGNNSVCQWRNKSLRISDLAFFKLIGLSKSCNISKAVERYVTIFDYEKETLWAPPYSTMGRFIDEILANKKQFPDELTYLSHVLYCLFDVGLKSCLYYYLCCIGVGPEANNPNSNNNNNNNNNHSRSSSVSSSSCPPSPQLHSSTSSYTTPTTQFSLNSSVSSSLNVTPSPHPPTTPPAPSSVTFTPPPPPLVTVPPPLVLAPTPTIPSSQLATARPHVPPNMARRTSLIPAKHSSPHIGKQPFLQSFRSLSDPLLTTPPSTTPVPPEMRDRWRAIFFRNLDIMPGDTDIIINLTEVVKEQQALEMQGGTRGGSLPPVVRLDFATCQTFKNVIKK